MKDRSTASVMRLAALKSCKGDFACLCTGTACGGFHYATTAIRLSGVQPFLSPMGMKKNDLLPPVILVNVIS